MPSRVSGGASARCAMASSAAANSGSTGGGPGSPAEGFDVAIAYSRLFVCAAGRGPCPPSLAHRPARRPDARWFPGPGPLGPERPRAVGGARSGERPGSVEGDALHHREDARFDVHRVGAGGELDDGVVLPVAARVDVVHLVQVGAGAL